MSRTLGAVAREVHGELIGPDASFGVVSIDTRNLSPGALFVAIRGEHFDGNDFVADAHSRGAVGALVSHPATVTLPQVRVRDTREAFGRMARAWRDNFSVPVLAITGSNGKTTVKELIASILRARRNVCVTEGNLNNDIGVPLTLMGLSAAHEVLVVELGANHPGEIGYLSELTGPTVGLITNANAAHLEGFGSIEGVAGAKGELMDHLPRAGTAVLNADDRFCVDWRARSRAESVLTFGFGRDADCAVLGEIESGAAGSRFEARLPDGVRVELELPLIGRHNVANAIAAAAAAHALGTSSEDIVNGLAQAHAVGGRLVVLRGRRGARIVDDSYNANPASVRAALDYLAGLNGRRVLVLGDMAELGDEAERLHSEIGEYARKRCDVLIGVGRLSGSAAEAYGRNGHRCNDIEEANRRIDNLLGDDVTILVKGSRVMGLESLVARLAAQDNPSEVGSC